MRARLHVFTLLGVVASLAAAAAVVRGQGKPAADASMSQLVSEVRALREAVERSGFLTARTQATLGRMQLQENRLATLGRQLQETRQRLRDRQAQYAQMSADLAMMAKALEGLSAGSEHHRDVEQALEALRLRAKVVQADVAEMQAGESELSQALSAEQGRWGDYNERLETLERELVSATRRYVQP
jgi:chromosome segregation ATPase